MPFRCCAVAGQISAEDMSALHYGPHGFHEDVSALPHRLCEVCLLAQGAERWDVEKQQEAEIIVQRALETWKAQQREQLR